MRWHLSLSLAIAAIAAPALADKSAVPPGTDWKALLVGAIEANGCKMTEDEAEVKLPPLGFGYDWTVFVLQDLVAEGKLVLEEETQTVIAKTEACS
ncbi:hypothetical protein HOY34_08480 [Xinfangfangia sp. D13-10-4-6]|uniref:hypothetical protein n=1 Tax=Pseudogemmobacter hezensis TaxID=2737662 RepID=UPI001551CBFD|nr:hypothetical protein [Pseudogemmobacter hezensis]NPD15233.1 hypothetical protein [Pseudogemmobacter hezensis]